MVKKLKKFAKGGGTGSPAPERSPAEVAALRKKVLEIANSRVAHNDWRSLPQSIQQLDSTHSNSNCIYGVCDVLKEAGAVDRDFYGNTDFEANAKKEGFTNPLYDIEGLQPGDVFQWRQGAAGDKFRPSHGQIFMGKNESDHTYRFWDNYNHSIREYDESSVKNALSAKDDRHKMGAQYISLNPRAVDKYESPYPYNQPEAKQEQYFGDTHEVKHKFSLKEPVGNKLSPLYYQSGQDVRDNTRQKLVDYMNDETLDADLRKKLKISDQDLQNIKPYVYGIIGQESSFDNPTSAARGMKYDIERTIPGLVTAGPAQIDFDWLNPKDRDALGIKKSSDLLDIKNAYTAAISKMREGKTATDRYIERGRHPELENVDPYARALYYYNTPNNVAKSDATNVNKRLKQVDWPYWTESKPGAPLQADLPYSATPEQLEQHKWADDATLRMGAGSYPDKVMKKANELNVNLDFETQATLPGVLVKGRKTFAGGGEKKPSQVFVNNPNDPRLSSYRDSLTLFNSYNELKQKLASQHYKKEPKVEDDGSLLSERRIVDEVNNKTPYTWFDRHGFTSRLPEIKAGKEGNLYKTLDFYPENINESLGHQYFSPKIKPTSEEEWRNEDLNDSRLVKNYSNVHPRQEIIYQPEQKKQVITAQPVKSETKRKPVAQLRAERPYVKTDPQTVSPEHLYNVPDVPIVGPHQMMDLTHPQQPTKYSVTYMDDNAPGQQSHRYFDTAEQWQGYVKDNPEIDIQGTEQGADYGTARGYRKFGPGGETPYAKNNFFNRMFNRGNILEQQIRQENGALANKIPLRNMRVDYAQGDEAELLEQLHHNPEYISPDEGLKTEKYGNVTIPKGKMLVNDDPNNPQFVNVNHPGKYTTLVNAEGLDAKGVKTAAANDFVSHALHGDAAYEGYSKQLGDYLKQQYNAKMIDGNGGVDAYMRAIYDVDNPEYQPYRDEMKFIPSSFHDNVRNYIKTGKQKFGPGGETKGTPRKLTPQDIRPAYSERPLFTAPTAEQLALQEAARKAQFEQRFRDAGTIKPATNRSKWDKASAVVTHPFTAASYAVKGKPLPDNFEKGETNVMDYAADIVNPAVYFEAAGRTLNNAFKPSTYVNAAKAVGETTLNLVGDQVPQSLKGSTAKTGSVLMDAAMTPEAGRMGQAIWNKTIRGLDRFSDIGGGLARLEREGMYGNWDPEMVDIMQRGEYGVTTAERYAKAPLNDVAGKVKKAATDLPKAKNWREIAGYSAGIPIPGTLPRLAPTDLKLYRKIQELGRMGDKGASTADRMRYALDNGIPDNHFQNIFSRSREEGQTLLDNGFGSNQPHTGSIDLVRNRVPRNPGQTREQVIRDIMGDDEAATAYLQSDELPPPPQELHIDTNTAEDRAFVQQGRPAPGSYEEWESLDEPGRRNWEQEMAQFHAPDYGGGWSEISNTVQEPHALYADANAPAGLPTGNAQPLDDLDWDTIIEDARRYENPVDPSTGSYRTDDDFYLSGNVVQEPAGGWQQVEIPQQSNEELDRLAFSRGMTTNEMQIADEREAMRQALAREQANRHPDTDRWREDAEAYFRNNPIPEYSQFPPTPYADMDARQAAATGPAAQQSALKQNIQRGQQAARNAGTQARQVVNGLKDGSLIQEKLLKASSSYEPYAGDVREGVPSLFMSSTGSSKDVASKVTAAGKSPLKSGDVMTGSLNTSHNSYLPQLKQVFGYKEGKPVFLGHQPMNSLGYLSKADIPNSDIVKYMNTEIDEFIRKSKVPKNIQRPFLSNDGHHVMLPQYGVKQFAEGGPVDPSLMWPGQPETFAPKYQVDLSTVGPAAHDFSTGPNAFVTGRHSIIQTKPDTQNVWGQNVNAAIGLNAGLGFIGHALENNNRNGYQQEMMAGSSDYGAPVVQGGRGDYVTNGGVFRPDQMVPRQFAAGGAIEDANPMTPMNIPEDPGGYSAPSYMTGPADAQPAPPQPPAAPDADFRQFIIDRESKGDYKALPRRKDGTLVSSAVGAYQFLWDKHKPEIMKVTGVKTKEAFQNNPQAQDAFFDYWDKNVLTPTAVSISQELGSNVSLNEIKAKVHFAGADGARKYYLHGIETKDGFGTTTSTYGNGIAPQTPAFTVNGQAGLQNASSWAVGLGNALQKFIPGFTPNSIYRTPGHNREVGGKQNSRHLSGNALDIQPGQWNNVPASQRKDLLSYYGAKAIDEGNHIHLQPYAKGGQYNEGEEYDLTDEEIQEIIKNGGSVEFA